MSTHDERPLEGWKAIATYLGRSERTAQRWKSKGIPISKHGVLGVIAYPSQLDEWVKSVQDEDASPQPGESPNPIAPARDGSNSKDSPQRDPSTTLRARSHHSRVVEASTAILGSEHTAEHWLPVVVTVGTVAILITLTAALLTPAYGFAVLVMWLGAVPVVLGSARWSDSALARVLILSLIHI